MSKDKDLFDDSTMSFGEHLEELRKRLILALIGLTIGVIIALFFSDRLVKTMEIPVKAALIRYYTIVNGGEDPGVDLWLQWKMLFSSQSLKDLSISSVKPKDESKPNQATKYIEAQIDVREVLKALHKLQPKIPDAPDGPPMNVAVRIPQEVIENAMPLPPTFLSLTALTAEEAFMVYLKVAMIAGLVLSSPWVFYQMWLFVAAGLYPHERKYVYTYLPMSLGLFFAGGFLCFFAVVPFVLKFLFDFNIWLDISIQPRLTEYITFIVILPVMFGISFQLPMVMLFLERIGIFGVTAYQERRKIAILVIAFLSMVLTPSDPVSMLLMLIPLCLLYEFGILLCKWQPNPNKNPFDDDKSGLVKTA